MNNLSIRLKQARKIAGLSLRGLADLVDLSHAAIKKYEDGEVYPSSEILLKLAKALNTRIDFFFRPTKVSLENVKFRKREGLSEKAAEKIQFEAINQIERRLELENLYPASPTFSFELPENFPEKIQNLEEIESIAEKLRGHWKLGLDPIHDLIASLESRGVRVFIVESVEEDFDGLYGQVNNQPIIVIGSRKPGDRQRFSLLHELAHHILYSRLSSNLNEEEACNRFAGAFLFPRETVFQAMGKKRHAIELQELFLLKEQFQISMAAICHRLKDLGIISESYYDILRKDFKKNGWLIKEPGDQIPAEKAQAFSQLVFHALGEGYIGESKAAELLNYTLNQFRQVQNLHAFSRK